MICKNCGKEIAMYEGAWKHVFFLDDMKFQNGMTYCHMFNASLRKITTAEPFRFKDYVVSITKK